MSDDTSAPQTTPEDENPFAQFVTPDTKSYAERSLFERAKDTFVAHFYNGPGIVGSSIAAAQADPVGYNERLIQGLTPEEQHLARMQVAHSMVEEARSYQFAENPVRVTPAQIAQIRNELWPKADSLGSYSADVLGALAGGAASPEQWFFPQTGAAGAVARMGAGRVLSGAIGTGASMAVVSGVTNPGQQIHQQKAGLRPMRGIVEQTEAAPAVPTPPSSPATMLGTNF
jgi:hypothetical protein